VSGYRVEGKLSPIRLGLDRRQFLIAAGAGTAAFMLAGCGVNQQQTGTDGGGKTTLRIATTDLGGERMDPVKDITLDEVTCAMWESPFTVDADGQLGPGIVTGYEPSADGTAWTLKMRDDIVFHDGSKVTSEDLAYAYERAVSDEAMERDFWRSLIGETPNIEIVDPTTVIVHTLGVQPLFIPYSSIYGGTIWLQPKALIESQGLDTFVKNPIGTGPYKFVKQVSATSIEFEAVENHWRIQPNFKSVQVFLTPQAATAVAQLKTGELDMVPVSDEDAKELEGAGFQIVIGVPNMVYLPIIGAMAPENQGKPLSDVRVRQALCLGINREEMIQALFGGTGASMPGPIRVGLDTMPDITDALRAKWASWCTENFRYDPDKAKSLLAEAGYPDGFSFALWNVPDSDSPVLSEIIQVIAGFWEKIGVKAEIQNVSSDKYDTSKNSREPDASIGVMAIASTSLGKASAAENVASNFASDGTFDALYGSPDEELMDAAWKEYNQSTDPAVEEAALDKIITIASECYIQIPVVDVNSLYAFGKAVGKVEEINTFNVGDLYATWPVAS
jgi:peptide/nickel transport system substrate-binding protein